MAGIVGIRRVLIFFLKTTRILGFAVDLSFIQFKVKMYLSKLSKITISSLVNSLNISIVSLHVE